jgi:hypothetical protein
LAFSLFLLEFPVTVSTCDDSMNESVLV